MWQNFPKETALALPIVNPFIPTDLGIKAKPENEVKYPVRIKETDLTRLWHKQDTTFNKPTAVFYLQMFSPLVYANPRTVLKANLISMLCGDALNEYAYYAREAGLSYTLHHSTQGLQLKVKGYNDKLGTLTQRILETLKTLVIKSDRFIVIKDMLKKSLLNIKTNQPYEHARSYLEFALLEPKWTTEEKLLFLDDIELKETQEFLNEMLSPIFLEGLVYGNMTSQEALGLIQNLENYLSSKALLSSEFPKQRLVQLDPGIVRYYARVEPNENNSNSAIFNYYQIGPQSNFRSSLLLLLCAHVIREAAFDTLRTKQQLGYIVWSGTMYLHSTAAFRVVVQSSVQPPEVLDERIEEFLISHAKTLESMSNEEFKNNVESLSVILLEKPLSQYDEVNKYIAEIQSQQYVFDRAQLLDAELKTATHKELLEFYYTNILKDSRKKFSVQVYGNKHNKPERKSEGNTHFISDPVAFKISMPLWPFKHSLNK
eukprot:TRINITY_DN1708_c0_g3_i6.p1 TRINITY_DN1708_c0_g3~~TRINITY_DN1708_c0_g3_i6.p1  ORF type:complete len:539 (+),score=83.70 TRINITY_DN1708_c0_g3_i6:161-1618(+)